MRECDAWDSDDNMVLEVSEGNGPVDALAKALDRALLPSFPSLASVELCDYKVPRPLPQLEDADRRVEERGGIVVGRGGGAEACAQCPLAAALLPSRPHRRLSCGARGGSEGEGWLLIGRGGVGSGSVGADPGWRQGDWRHRARDGRVPSHRSVPPHPQTATRRADCGTRARGARRRPQPPASGRADAWSGAQGRWRGSCRPRERSCRGRR